MSRRRHAWPRFPQTTLYSVEPGPNEILPDTPWGWRARLLPKTATPGADLAAYFARELGDAPVTTVRRGPALPAGDVLTPAMAKGSDHIARLWARDRVLELMSADAKANRPAALALAVQHRLITPISGAVVLETQQQYDEARMTPVSPSNRTDCSRTARMGALGCRLRGDDLADAAAA